MKKGAIGAL